MAILVLKDAEVVINSVDLSAYVTSVTVNYEIEAVEATAMGGNRSYIGGLQNNSISVALNQDFAASQVEATIFPLVGTQTTVAIKPTTGAISSTNPEYEVTGTYLAASQPVQGAVGELAAMTLEFTGGTLTKATS